MSDQWLGTTWEQLGFVAVSAVVMFVVAVIVIRVVGLRSLSKMSSFDFVVTVALGSIVASAVATSTSIWNAALAFAALLGVQSVVAWLRRHAGFSRWVDNEPLLLMLDGEMLPGHLDRARVTESDVIAKLREANVISMSDVLAVVLETTGDISVLHGEGPLEDRLLDGVRQPAAS